MIPIDSADATGMNSCLISGGCDTYGKVPFDAHLEQIKALRTGRLLNWHVGMINETEMRRIAPYTDVISFDFCVDRETVQAVYDLPYDMADYMRAYEMLRRYARVVPHLTLGLHESQFHGEYQALETLKTAGLDALVLLVLIPTPGTRYAHCAPPALTEVTDFILSARRALPTTPLYLGCMRPGGQYRRKLDELAVQAGINKIVNPAPSAIRAAERLGLQIQWENECCAIQRD